MSRQIQKKVELDKSWCKGCGICVAFCPKGVLALDMESEKAWVMNPGDCIGCQMCERLCPDLAITVIQEELAK